MGFCFDASSMLGLRCNWGLKGRRGDCPVQSRVTFVVCIFLTLYIHQASSINDVLRDYEPYGGVFFHWRTIGSSGHDRRPQGSVVDSYSSCLPPEHKVRQRHMDSTRLYVPPCQVSTLGSTLPSLCVSQGRHVSWT